MNRDPWQFSPETLQDMKQVLIEYMEEQFDLPMGNLAAELMLRHIQQELAPYYYNAGLRDAARYLSDRLLDMGELEMLPPSARHPFQD